VACSSSGSSASPPRVCTLIGAQSQVSFTLADASIVRGDVVRLCVDAHCHTMNAAEVRAKFATVPDAALRSGPSTVTMTVRSTSGRLVTTAVGKVHASKRQPNGPGCSPTVWQAAVRAGGDHLTQTMEG
jgi:hypothetical protein